MYEPPKLVTHLWVLEVQWMDCRFGIFSNLIAGTGRLNDNSNHQITKINYNLAESPSLATRLQNQQLEGQL